MFRPISLLAAGFAVLTPLAAAAVNEADCIEEARKAYFECTAYCERTLEFEKANCLSKCDEELRDRLRYCSAED